MYYSRLVTEIQSEVTQTIDIWAYCYCDKYEIEL